MIARGFVVQSGPRTAASMPHEGKTSKPRCNVSGCFRPSRGAPAIASLLLLYVSAAASSALVFLHEAFRDSFAFQHSRPLGPMPGALGSRRANRLTRDCQRPSQPILKWSAMAGWATSRRRPRALVWLEDSARDEIMFERATSDESIPDEGGIAHGHGGSIEGPALVGGNGSSSNLLEEETGVIAASVPVAVDSLEPAQSEELETEVASFEFAPAMTVHKFKTMQDRRVPVTIKYSGGGGFKRYFEEISTVLKRQFPDVLIEREIVEMSSTREEEVFEIRIDGKLVCAKRRGKPGVFLPMDTFAQAIRKARQRRRPGSVVYGDEETYTNVKALTDQRTEDDSLERDFEDLDGSGNVATGR